MSKSLIPIILIPVVLTILFTAFFKDTLSETNSSMTFDREVKESVFLFTSKEECQKHSDQIEVPCNIAFGVAEKKAVSIGKQMSGLVTCKRFFDPTCEMSEEGYPSPTMVGIYYITSDVPTISPVFLRPTSGTYQLPSGCIVRKTDTILELDGRRENIFSYTNYQDQTQIIRVPSGKTTKSYPLHEYIDKNKNQKLKRRVRACLED